MGTINERQTNDARYSVHDQWRERNRDALSGQNARKRANDQRLNPVPGRAQGGMEAAREAVRCAKERGELVQPANCQNPKCGVETDQLIFHHSHGYAQENWLKGSFLCHKCHTADNNKDGDDTYRGEPVRGPRKGIEEDRLVSDIARMITEDPDIFTD